MRKVYLFLFYTVVVFSLRVGVVGSGIEARYNFSRGPNYLLLSIGSLWGDGKISIIDPSTFLKMEYSKEENSPNSFSESQTYISQAFVKISGKVYPFTVFSGIESRAKQFSLSDSVKFGIGLIQNAFMYYQWSGAVGLEYIFTPGADFMVCFSSSVGFIAGTDGEIMVIPRDVQNINIFKSSLSSLAYNLWLRFFVKKIDIDVRYTYTPAVEKYTFGIGYCGRAVRLGGEVHRSQNIMFPDKEILKVEAKLLTLEEKVLIFFNGSYERMRYNVGGYCDDNSIILVSINIPIGVKKGGDRKIDIRFSFDETIGGDKYLEKGRYSYFYSDAYYSFSERVIFGIKSNKTFMEFIKFIKDELNTVDESLWLGSVMGDLCGRWIYDYRGMTLEGIKEDIFKDTLRNIATNDQIYNSLREAIMSGEVQPTTVCRGISRFVADVINTAATQESDNEVFGYTARVDVEGGGHIIVPVITDEQIFLIDYNNIIPTRTRNISTALQVYENLNRCFTLQHYVWERGNKLLYKIDTPDTLLLKRFFVTRSDTPPGRYLEELLYNIHLNAW